MLNYRKMGKTIKSLKLMEGWSVNSTQAEVLKIYNFYINRRTCDEVLYSKLTPEIFVSCTCDQKTFLQSAEHIVTTYKLPS